METWPRRHGKTKESFDLFKTAKLIGLLMELWMAYALYQPITDVMFASFTPLTGVRDPLEPGGILTTRHKKERPNHVNVTALIEECYVLACPYGVRGLATYPSKKETRQEFLDLLMDGLIPRYRWRGLPSQRRGVAVPRYIQLKTWEKTVMYQLLGNYIRKSCFTITFDL